jgi:medium-chain acyl-[acyl-carrier-protein] hydrolase
MGASRSESGLPTVKDHSQRCEPAWIEHLSPTKTPSLRLFCFPYAGGSADVYRSWRRFLPEELDVCLVHLPGRGGNIGKRPFTRFPALMEEIADRISFLIGIPYVLYGHSMGALIGFELARELRRRQGASPQHIFVSSCSAPQQARKEPITFNLPKAEFLRELGRLKGTPAEVLENPELMELFMDVLRADFEMVETYEYIPGEPLSCPITVYGGLADDNVSTEGCQAWKQQTSAICKVRMFKGDHFFIRNLDQDFTHILRADILQTFESIDRQVKHYPKLTRR